jgi:hypothetical protein
VNKKRISIPEINPLDTRFKIVQDTGDESELPGKALSTFLRRAKGTEGTSSDPGFREVHSYDYPGDHNSFILLRNIKSFAATREEALMKSLIHVVDLTGKGTQVIGEGVIERQREDYSSRTSEPVVTLNEDAEGKEGKGYNIRRLALMGAVAIKLWDSALATSGNISDQPSDTEAWEALAEKGIAEPYEAEIADGVTQIQYRFINPFKQK